MIPIIFLHIPRTGGMSFRKIMDQVYGSENIGRCWWGDHAGKPIDEKDKNKSAWYGHFKFGLHTQLKDPDTKYLTILREPSARLVSEYLRNGYREKFGWTPKQFAENVSQAFGWDNYGDNLQVRMISGAEKGELITRLHVYRAIENIRNHFVHVGYSSQYNDLIDFVKEKLEWNVISVPSVNKGPGGSITIQELNELRKCDQLQFDYEFYAALRRAELEKYFRDNHEPVDSISCVDDRK